MQLDVVNQENEKVGTVDVREDVFGGRVNADLMWESVVHANAAERRGTHMTKNRALVSGSGRKPWRQKGTGRARVGEIRNPLWRKGGTVFGPRPRSYDFRLPKKVERGALRAALAQKVKDQALVVVDALAADAIKTKAAVELLKRLGCDDKAVLVDVAVDEKLSRSVKNIPGVSFVASARLTARDVIHARRVVATRGALERLQEAPAEQTMKLTDVIRRPLITEKTSILREDGRTIVFQVAPNANKMEVKRAIEKLLGSKVESVRTSIAHGKVKRQGRFAGRRSDWKKAYVRLAKGAKMPEFLEGA